MKRASGPPADVIEAAADWIERLRGELTASEQEEFIGWLRESSVHVEEFLRITSIQEALKRSFRRHPEWVDLLLEGELNNDLRSGRRH